MSTLSMRTGDVGTQLVVTITDENGAVVDVSGATDRTIRLQKPDGAVLTRAAVNDTDGTNGAIRYTTALGDVDQPGIWKIDASVTMSGATWSTTAGSILVQAAL